MLKLRQATLTVVLFAIVCATAKAQDASPRLPCNEYCQQWFRGGLPEEQSGDDGPAQTHTISVEPDRATMVNDYYSLHPNCRSRGRVEVVLTQAPRSGQVFVDQARMHPAFASDDGMAVCNNRKVNVTRVTYQPREMMVGNDEFAVRVRFPNGQTTDERYVLTAQ